jgi:hypothetical protein
MQFERTTLTKFVGGPSIAMISRCGFRPVGAVHYVVSECAELGSRVIGAYPVPGGSRGRPHLNQTLDLVGDFRALVRWFGVVPDPVKVKPQHQIRVERKPSFLVIRDVGAQQFADGRQRARQVEVVVNCLDELEVECPTFARKLSVSACGAIGDRERRSA